MLKTARHTTIPKKYLNRQEEITVQFLDVLNSHLDDIVAGRVDEMYHIKDIAALLFLHPVHLSNTIKLYTGHKPCYFFEHRILQEAKRMLDDPSRSIADVAARLTYDTSNFTKFFKAFAGITPSAYRKQRALLKN